MQRYNGGRRGFALCLRSRETHAKGATACDRGGGRGWAGPAVKLWLDSHLSDSILGQERLSSLQVSISAMIAFFEELFQKELFSYSLTVGDHKPKRSVCMCSYRYFLKWTHVRFFSVLIQVTDYFLCN